MKLFSNFLFTLVLGISSSLTAQDLSSFDTIVHYSLINTAADQLGHVVDIELLNTPFEDTNGVYCNGLYINGFNPDGSLVKTPRISALHDTAFAVSMEFKIDSFPSTIAPVFICGNDWRYLGMLVQWDGLMMYNFNGTTYMIAGADVSIGDWHIATCVYNSLDSMAQFWLDEQLIATHSGALEREEYDDYISNTHFGNGFTFLGNLRNLRIFSSEDFVLNAESTISKIPARIFPNPVQNDLNIIDAEYTSWHIYTISGTEVAQGKYSPDQSISVDALSIGTYVIVLRDDHHAIIFRQKFHKQ